MKRVSSILLSLLAGLSINCSGDLSRKTDTRAGSSYYLSIHGDDNNPGTLSKPWRSLAKINSIRLSPGDSVLLEGGSTFEGTLMLDKWDSASASGNIVITSYGNGRATIYSGDRAALHASQCDHLTIHHLTFKGTGRKNGNTSDGLYFENCNNLTLDHLETSGFQHAGLHVHKSYNASITHVYAHDNGFAGIHVNGGTKDDPDRYDNKDLYIGYCVAENNPGDPTVIANHSGNGILASSVDGGVIEYCEAFNNGWDMPWTGNGPVGIWIWDATDFIIQHCIAHHNKTAKGAGDGGGFDFDGGVSNSVLQYNFSYENEGPGIGLFEFGATKPWQNNVVRYNISQNDGKNGAGSLGIWKGKGEMRNCLIYNNTFYNSNPNGPSLWIYNNWEGFRFYNNIFVYNGPFLFKGHSLKDEEFKGNIYWNLQEEQAMAGYRTLEDWIKATGNEIVDGKTAGMMVDPVLKNPGQATLTDPLKLSPEHLPEYLLQARSPAIDEGIDLHSKFGIESGSRDFYGNHIPSGAGFDIGAHEFTN